MGLSNNKTSLENTEIETNNLQPDNKVSLLKRLSQNISIFGYPKH